MYCVIYKSRKKQDTYLYMASKDDFSRVPDALLALLGNPVYVMEIELNAERRLAQEDVLEVLRNLQERGWHLQMPQREDWPGMH
jgi:uncharacterized protein YcgL (UPF0745 family)